jgi:hypothetical protein
MRERKENLTRRSGWKERMKVGGSSRVYGWLMREERLSRVKRKVLVISLFFTFLW